jgi:hypothetical protein
MRLGLTIAALLLAVPVHAQGSAGSNVPIELMKERVAALAFDPWGFFEWPHGNLVNIRYRGDDWGWPVYSIAIQNGCEDEQAPHPACRDRRIARMVRAPVGPRGAERPRWRGADLVSRIFATGAATDDAIRAQLDDAGIEWLEADLQSCPGAMVLLGRAEAVQWAPRKPPKRDEIVVTLHADTIEVGFDAFDGRVSWSGPPYDGTPSRWAIDFAAQIEPCWRPAKAPTPWRRVPATD